jgi:hypothetical protein
MAAAPLTGCVLRNPADAELLDEEREGLGWENDPIAWCLGESTAERALELGWRNIRQLRQDARNRDLIGAIGGQDDAA